MGLPWQILMSFRTPLGGVPLPRLAPQRRIPQDPKMDPENWNVNVASLFCAGLLSRKPWALKGLNLWALKGPNLWALKALKLLALKCLNV